MNAIIARNPQVVALGEKNFSKNIFSKKISLKKKHQNYINKKVNTNFEFGTLYTNQIMTLLEGTQTNNCMTNWPLNGV
jgi:hypothetical protein